MFERQTLKGAWFATAAYGFWGVAPIYFKWVAHVSPYEIVSQRVVWSLVLLLGILVYIGRLDALRLPREHWWKIAVTAALLSFNWFIFIYTVVNDNIAEASLGYFINPLVSVFFGMVFLGERLRPLQWIAIAIAATGILISFAFFGRIPWLGLTLAFTFGFYGLIRKSLALHSAGGLAIETMIMFPVALGYLGYLAYTGDLAFANVDLRTDLLLIAAGFVTSFPLLCFAAAVNRLSLTAAGLFQYIAPTLSLMIAVLMYGEPFDLGSMITFGCIWTALIIFTVETLYYHRRIARRFDRDKI